jgi:diguanylate cyclase (GGDEF)-like protein
MLGFAILLVSGGGLYSNIDDFEKRLKSILLEDSITFLDDALSNVIDDMLKNNPDFVQMNLKDKKLRTKNEEALRPFNTSDINSLYLLILKENKLFFLLDTAEDTDTGDVLETFMPEEDEEEAYFKAAIQEQTKQLFIQNKLGNLGFTLIKPIINNKELIGLLVVDYTQSKLASLSEIISIKSLGIALLVMMLMLFAFIYYIIHLNSMKYKIYYNVKTNTLNRVFLTDNYEKIDFAKYYVVLADLDFFKKINNLYGHENGDKVITSVILIINSFLDKNDKFIQYSGEEFLLLMSKKNRDEELFKKLLEDIRERIAKTNFSLMNESFSLTISLGALIHTELEKSLQDSIHKADTALYRSKYNGRNRVSYFDVSERKRLHRETLKEMIDSDKLVCYYQPIRSLHTHKLHHYEALLRIKDGKNILFPDTILPDLENSHLYSVLTKRIIEFNVEKLREDSKIKIAINLSADDLINDSILSLLAQNSDLSERLFIEILENKSIDYSKVEHSIQRLKMFGYKICIDDFGAGYSNINHLLNLSIDFLKIDGSIIKEINHDKRAYSIVKTFALFCQQNNIEMIAEFIDTQDVVDTLKGFGVEYGQGWYFSKALPYEELDKEHL